MAGTTHNASTSERAFLSAHDGGSTIARLGLIGGVILIAAVTVLAIDGPSKSREYMAYLFLGSIAPLLAASLLFMARDRPRLLALLAPAPRLFLIFVLIGTLLLGGLEYLKGDLLSTSWPFLIVVVASALATARLCLPRCRPHRLPVLSDPVRRVVVLKRLDALLIALLVAFTVFFSRFYPAGYPGVPFPSDLVIYIWETPHFAVWLLFGLAFTGAAIWLWRFEERTPIRRKRLIERLALLFVVLFVLGLFDDGLYVNLSHYMPYVGPAMHAYHGGIAMVDVYSIYGLLPWVVVKVAFDLMGPTFGAAAVVVSLSQLPTLLAMIVSLYAISRRPLAALGLMVPAILVAVTFLPGFFNLGAYPSLTGLRYLTPSLMVVALILSATRPPAWMRWIGAVILVVASFWSLEALVYSIAPWGYVLLLQAVRERSLRNAGLTFLAGFGGVFLGHAAFALATFLATGATVDYHPYFGQFLRFRPDAESVGFWQQPFDQNYMIWVPVILGHTLVLAVAAYRALQGRAPTDIPSRLVPVAAYGFIALNYFMGRQTWAALGFSFLPVAIELICALEALSAKPRKYGTIGVAALLALVAVSSIMIAFSTERFVRPMAPYLGNSSVLRHCFTSEGCNPARIVAHLKRSIAAAPLDPDSPASLYFRTLKLAPFPVQEEVDKTLESIMEAVDILKRWTPNQRRVALLADSFPYDLDNIVNMTVLMQTGQWYRWPISAPLNDELSEPLVALILRRVAEKSMQDGEILVVSNDRKNLKPLEQKILAVVTARCRLALVEALKFHSTYRMEACGSAHRPT